MSDAYYSENDPVACAVLREAIQDKIIAPGYVDSRSIKDVRVEDLYGFEQHHFFAGAGLWSVACRLADWPDDRRIWTASCPCQGWSVAGKGLGFDDPRDLWPDLFRLWRAYRPAVGMGEITSGSAILPWLDRTCADLEGENYACRAVSVPACAVDAPNIRQRLWWSALRMGHADSTRADINAAQGRSWTAACESDDRRVSSGTLGDTDRSGCTGSRLHGGEREGVSLFAGADGPESDGASSAIALADAEHSVWRAHDDLRRSVNSAQEERRIKSATEFRKRDNPSCSFWHDAEWIACADGKTRRAKPGIRLLAHGLAGRTDLWRLAGNSINPVLAAEVIKALKDQIDAQH